MSDCASILSSTSPRQDTRAKRRANRLRLHMTVRIPLHHRVAAAAAEEHDMSDDQYSSSDNEAFEEVILLPPVADEGEHSSKILQNTYTSGTSTKLNSANSGFRAASSTVHPNRETRTVVHSATFYLRSVVGAEAIPPVERLLSASMLRTNS